MESKIRKEGFGWKDKKIYFKLLSADLDSDLETNNILAHLAYGKRDLTFVSSFYHVGLDLSFC